MVEAKVEGIYVPSEGIVAREIQGEVIIVPLVSGIGDLEDEIYALSDTGKEIWALFDGRNSLQEITHLLSEKFEGESGEIQADVLGLARELLQRGILVEAPY